MSDSPAAGPRPTRPHLSARSAYALHALVAPREPYRWLATWLERHRLMRRWFTAGERITKQEIFGCQMCGQCALPATGYACPMTCPKQLRNGPCGGVSPTGQCEVHPEMRCVWVIAFERAERAGHGADLDLLQRPVDRRETGRSSWVNYWLGRDEDLWAAATPGDPAPLLPRTPAGARR
jgi:Methylene-tetrahydrofolate reductase C terminal